MLEVDGGENTFCAQLMAAVIHGMFVDGQSRTGIVRDQTFIRVHLGERRRWIFFVQPLTLPEQRPLSLRGARNLPERIPPMPHLQQFVERTDSTAIVPISTASV
jgi:hypothetical protein